MTTLVLLVWPKLAQPVENFLAPLEGANGYFAQNIALPNRVVCKAFTKPVDPPLIIGPAVSRDPLAKEDAIHDVAFACQVDWRSKIEDACGMCPSRHRDIFGIGRVDHR